MDLRERAEASQSALERVAGIIPGYRGYKEKELRREADKLLRSHLARRFEEERGRLNALQDRLADRGQFQVLVALERSMMKFQLLIDRLKTANYGYAGWFDAIKVREPELDALYAYDRSLVDGVEAIGQRLSQISAATEEGVLLAASETFWEALDQLNASFTRRMDLILGLEGGPSAPPQEKDPGVESGASGGAPS